MVGSVSYSIVSQADLLDQMTPIITNFPINLNVRRLLERHVAMLACGICPIPAT